MKKLILALLAMGTIATVNAQEPHSILLYGDATIKTVSDSIQHKTTNWDANIGIGYQFNHNWTIGLKIMWGQDRPSYKALKILSTIMRLARSPVTRITYAGAKLSSGIRRWMLTT
jgi:hypothetical protein